LISYHVSDKYGIGFGTRIRYYSSNCSRKLCFFGGMMIGTDSHTVNGGLGMLAIGVGWS
jgi:aconitate hydratase